MLFSSIAKRAGRKAKKEGLGEDANPYPKGSQSWAEWLSGYRS